MMDGGLAPTMETKMPTGGKERKEKAKAKERKERAKALTQKEKAQRDRTVPLSRYSKIIASKAAFPLKRPTHTAKLAQPPPRLMVGARTTPPGIPTGQMKITQTPDG